MHYYIAWIGLGPMTPDENFFWLLYWLFLFLAYAIPLVLVLLLIFLIVISFKGANASQNQVEQKRGYLQYIFYTLGVITVLVNIVGSRYSEKPILLDNILLALPFIFGGICVTRSLPKNTRIIAVFLAIFFFIAFLATHYPRWF